MFIYKVCAALKNAKVPYAIVGGYAVGLHGVVRGTMDVDLVIDWSLKNLCNTEAAFKKIGLVSRIPINADDLFHFRDEYMQNRNLIAWNFYEPSNPLHQIDIVISYDLKEKDHVKKVRTEGGDIYVLCLEELIKMKKKAGRPQDLEDIKALTEL